ncbi:MAG: acyl-CoA dehydrogenase family protein [Bacteroidota bacterium]
MNPLPPIATRDRAALSNTQPGTYRAFAARELAPYADAWHASETFPMATIKRVAAEGYLGMTLPRRYGGGEASWSALAQLAEAFGWACSAARSLLTVHSMVAHTIERCGSDEQRACWLPRLACGEQLAAFALSEPEVGSDANAVATSARSEGDDYVLSGTKKWTTFAETADVFLVFAQEPSGLAAFVVERSTPGLEVDPIRGLLGVRAGGTCTVRLNGCRVPRANRLGRPGMGGRFALATALVHGRLTVAAGCVGLAQAALEASARYTSERHQFGQPLMSFQLVRRLITDMSVQTEAARGLTQRAARLLEATQPDGPTATAQAKYYAAIVAAKATADAVQLHGGSGCSSEHSVQRFFCDAKVMELIEGTNEIHQITLAQDVYRRHGAVLQTNGNANVFGKTDA